MAFTFIAFVGSTAAVAFTDPGHAGAFAQQAVGVPPLAIFTAAVALSTGRQERANVRERVLSQVGTILATTSDRSVIAQMSAEAGARLLAGAPGTWSAVTLIGEDGEDVAHASGAVPIGLETGRLDMPEMPAELSRAFRDGEPVYFGDGGYSTRGGQRLLVPLRTDKHLYGTLLAGGDKSVPAEVKVSVEGLVAQTTLGLVNAEYAADLRHQAFHDGLTGLANRTLLREHLGHALSRAQRGSPVAVLLIDLDGFKEVNDNFGHAAGDHLLIVVAQRLRDAIRGADTAARLGGDEFAVLLDGMDAPEDALQVSERLLAAIQAPLRVGDVEIQPCGSIGVAVWHGHATIDALLHDADIAMYAAKTAGKGRLAHLDDGGTVHVLSLPTELGARTPVS